MHPDLLPYMGKDQRAGVFVYFRHMSSFFFLHKNMLQLHIKSAGRDVALLTSTIVGVLNINRVS